MTVIAICGTPGTGKSSLAEKFSKYCFKVIHLSEFVIENKLYSDYDRIRKAYIIDENKLISRLRSIINENENIVIEGIGAEIIPSNMVDICVVLTCEPFELERRLYEKGFSRKKINENLEAERFGIILLEAIENFGKEKTIVIDTTYRTIDEIFDVIINELKIRGLFKTKSNNICSAQK